jgi:hypothetical protein
MAFTRRTRKTTRASIIRNTGRKRILAILTNILPFLLDSRYFAAPYKNKASPASSQGFKKGRAGCHYPPEVFG